MIVLIMNPPSTTRLDLRGGNGYCIGSRLHGGEQHFLWLHATVGLHLRILMAEKLLQDCVKSGQIQQALDLFRCGSVLEEPQASLLVSSCAENDRIDDAIAVYADAKHRGYHLQPAALWIYLHRLVKNELLDEALRAISDHKGHPGLADPSQASGLVISCCHSCPQQSLQLYMGMKGSVPALSGEEISCNAIIHGLCTRCEDHDAHLLDSLLELYSDMRAKGSRVSDVVFSDLLQVCISCGAVKDAQQIFEDATTGGDT